MRTDRLVAGADGVRLAVYQTAAAAGLPVVLFVHGWAQSSWCWRRQLADQALTERFCLAAVDLRGHGGSDAPAGGYGEAAVWAADLAAVIAALPSRPVLLVGWSYGGLVIKDYLAAHGTAHVAGLLLAGAITGIGRGQPAGRVGPVMRAALPAALDEDPAVAVPALTAFVRGMTPRPLPGEDAQRLIGIALATPSRVRAALFDRSADGISQIAGVESLPVLVLHGTEDRVVDPSTAEHHLATIPGARADWWRGTGHLPFVEDEQRFAATLVSFAQRCYRHRERIST